jgi:hypothetical protein
MAGLYYLIIPRIVAIALWIVAFAFDQANPTSNAVFCCRPRLRTGRSPSRAVHLRRPELIGIRLGRQK